MTGILGEKWLKFTLLQETMNRKGVTLIEVLVALTILAIAFSAFFAFLNNAINKVSFSSSMNSAIFLLEEKLEDLYHKDFNSTELSDTLTSNNNNLFPQITENVLNSLSSYFDHYEVTNLNGKNFYILWNVKNLTSLVKEVGVTVYWRLNNKGHSVSALTFIRNRKWMGKMELHL